VVSWTNLFPADPPGGSFTAFGRAPATSLSADSWGFYDTWYYLASPGVVDSNIGTRMQYPYNGVEVDGGALQSSSYWAGLIFDAADEAARAGRVMTATAYVAPASAFGVGVTPTVAQIRSNSTIRSRLTSSLSAAGTLKTFGRVNYPAGTRDPNTKYWIAVVPSYVVDMGVPPTTTSDTPIGDINTMGRGLSFWMNRSPSKPKILTPPAQSTVLAGSTTTLVFEPQGPDRIASFPGDGGPNDLDDLAGVQIQYAPQPTEDDPTPEWTDMSIFDNIEPPFVDGAGWYIDGTTRLPDPPAHGDLWYGAYRFWRFRDLPIQCGGPRALITGSAYLPSGDWQVRVRTFDYGHPLPNSTDLNPWITGFPSTPALADLSGDFDADTFPASNTSPWSDPVLISVSEQVPPPLPLSPTNGIAVPGDTSITLVWQYRNNFAFPALQDQRTVQIRKVGDAAWTTLASGASSEHTLEVTGFALVSGNQYEWRVKVVDDTGVESAYSDVARFWMVPEPESGSVIPLPGDSIDGGTLGCGTHRVEVYRRGGKVRVGEIKNIQHVEWNRLRDDISDARIVITNWDIDCGNLLANLHTWQHEIVIFRDNGESSDRVWEGPITLLTYEKDRVVIQAKDVMSYMYRRIVKQDVVDSGNSPTAGRSVVARAVAILQNAFGPDDPNVLAYLNPIYSDNDAKQYRSLPAYSRTVYEEIDDMAANAGLDYAAVGRAIVVWGTKNRIGTLPEFRDADLGNSLIVSEYGMSMANRYVVSDGNGVWGEATRLDADGNDEANGLVEMLSSTWASDSATETGTYTEAGLQEVSESFAESAERSIASRFPAPVVVRVPDNTRVNPDAVVSIQHLVPGVVVPLHSVNTLREVRANQKLDSVKVVEEAGVETVTVTLSPFARQDNEVGEGEGA
jgi:hypothetical protein